MVVFGLMDEGSWWRFGIVNDFLLLDFKLVFAVLAFIEDRRIKGLLWKHLMALIIPFLVFGSLFRFWRGCFLVVFAGKFPSL